MNEFLYVKQKRSPASSAAEVRPREERCGSAGGAQTRARPNGKTRPLPVRDEQVLFFFLFLCTNLSPGSFRSVWRAAEQTR